MEFLNKLDGYLINSNIRVPLEKVSSVAGIGLGLRAIVLVGSGSPLTAFVLGIFAHDFYFLGVGINSAYTVGVNSAYLVGFTQIEALAGQIYCKTIVFASILKAFDVVNPYERYLYQLCYG